MASEIVVSDDSRVDNSEKSCLPATVDGKFFTVCTRNDKKITVKCMMCPNKMMTAQIDCTSNLLKHLKVCTQSRSSLFIVGLEYRLDCSLLDAIGNTLLLFHCHYLWFVSIKMTVCTV